jgi:hypothetical protein
VTAGKMKHKKSPNVFIATISSSAEVSQSASLGSA